jgi:hypothetical protein
MTTSKAKDAVASNRQNEVFEDKEIDEEEQLEEPQEFGKAEQNAQV